MKQLLKYTLSGLLLVTMITACKKVYESIEVIDDQNVTAYIQKNNLNVKEYQDTGIYYEVLSPGTGDDLDYSDQIPAILTIKSLDGTYATVDTFSKASRFFDYLGYFSPKGLRVGVKEVLKKRNGTLRMVIPSRLAFGRNGAGDIPGNASLDITIKVLDKDKIAQYDDFSIQKYMQSNNLTDFKKTASGMYYKITELGSGSPITIDSTVAAEYTGKLFNGFVFDKTVAGSPATFALSGVVKGWQEGIPLINKGGSIRLIMPSALGYGLVGSSPIPAFSCLDFTVKVVEKNK